MTLTILYAVLAILFLSFAIVLVRLVQGPTNMDRAVGLDVITSACVGIIVVVMAITGRIDLMPLLVVFTSIGFISSTTIARFSQVNTIGDSHIMTKEESEANPEPEFDEEDAPVHPDADDSDDTPIEDLLDPTTPSLIRIDSMFAADDQALIMMPAVGSEDPRQETSGDRDEHTERGKES